jgi:hypothetical protein
MSDLIMFKALNGEEVVAHLIEDTEQEVTIEKARVLATQQNPNDPGTMSVGLIPWFVGAPDETVTISKAHIFATVKVIPMTLQDGYIQQTSSIDLSGKL